MAYRPILPLLLLTWLAGAGAAELGEPRVSSFRGQALVADIELSALDDPAGAVQVRVANPDVYRGASIGVPPILSALTLTVVRQGGKQFVHVTSSRPVDTDMLHLFLELGQGSQRDVRLASLALAADPRPAPPPVAVAVAVALPAPVPVPAPVAVTAPVDTPVTVIKPAAPLQLAPASTALPASVRAPVPASCKASSPNNACAVLDTKNVALQAKLVGLEGKVKLLEAALAPAAHAETPPVVAPIAAIKPAAAPVAAPVAVAVMPKKHKPAAPAPSSTPWLWIGVAAVVALAALGAIVFLLLRRRRASAAPAEPAAPKPPGLMAGVRNRLMRNKEAAVEA